VRAGHAIVSFGPWLEFSARVQGAGAAGIPGSHLTGSKLALHVAWRDVPSGAHLHLTRGKEVLRRQDVSGAGELAVTDAVSEPSWYGAEIWGGDAPLAISNPIYVLPEPEREGG
jgi:hypothetical protein